MLTETETEQSTDHRDQAVRPVNEGDVCLEPAILERLSAEDAEEAIGRMLADELSFALVSVAADPDRRFLEGSLAARVRGLYEKHRSAICKGAPDRAQALLRLPIEERRRLFGSFAEADADALDRFSRARSNPTLAALLRRSVGQRVRGFASKGSLEDLIADRYIQRPRTSVWAFRNLGQEHERFLGREVSMVGSPDNIGFRWVTAEPDAEVLHWTLFEAGSPQPIASGTEEPAPVGTFSIDFKDHLPAKPSKEPLRYVLSCQPRIAPKIHHLGGASAGGGKTVKEPSQAAGAPAPPIRIVYSIDKSFDDFEFREMYRNLELYVDSITMVEDQSGSGDEEFWIAGTVQEVFGAGTAQESGAPIRMLRTKQPTLPPVSGFVEEFGDVREHGFELNRFDAPTTSHEWWPRHYIVTLTIWEEDAGDEVAAFLTGLNSLVNDFIGWNETVIEALDELGIELQPHQVTQLTAMIVAATTTSVLGAAVAAAAFAVATVVADLGDDYYGTKISRLPLPSSEVEAVHSVPTDGKAGLPMEDGGWRLATDVLQFKGSPGASQAAGWDGIVEIRLHWEASGRDFW